jgi:hypothetical protein
MFSNCRLPASALAEVLASEALPEFWEDIVLKATGLFAGVE